MGGIRCLRGIGEGRHRGGGGTRITTFKGKAHQMPILGLSQSVCGDRPACCWRKSTPRPVISLAFSPVKLILLLGWVYLSLYLVQRIDDSPLVPSQYKSILYVVDAVCRALGLFGAGAYRTPRIRPEARESFAAIVQRPACRAHHLAVGRGKGRDDSTLRLFDSTGTELSEIYGHGENAARKTGTSWK